MSSSSQVRCQISEMNKGKPSDTLPRPGRVNQVCKEWLVLEDGALAYQLQQEEVSKHLSGNKMRNALVREDFPRAVVAQREAEEEAARLAAIAEERDRMVAQQLAAQLEKKGARTGATSQQEHTNIQTMVPQYRGDMNTVGLPPPPTPPPHPEHLYEHISPIYQGMRRLRLSYEEAEEEDEVDESWPPPPPPEPPLSVGAGLTREEQERRDQELAVRLQQEEESSLELDRRLAMEAQDEELARLLQDKEKARAKRAREKAKAKKLAASAAAAEPLLPTLSGVPMTTPGVRGAPEMSNIAMAIDPTYTPQSYSSSGSGSASSSLLRSSTLLYHTEREDDVGDLMPVQGQKRSSRNGTKASK